MLWYAEPLEMCVWEREVCRQGVMLRLCFPLYCIVSCYVAVSFLSCEIHCHSFSNTISIFDFMMVNGRMTSEQWTGEDLEDTAIMVCLRKTTQGPVRRAGVLTWTKLSPKYKSRVLPLFWPAHWVYWLKYMVHSLIHSPPSVMQLKTVHNLSLI
jgi:hypothetical protein